MNSEEANAGKSAREIHETLYDGADLTVTFTDGRPPETVKVRKIPRREFARFASAWGDEDAEAAAYTQRAAGWVAALTEESFDAVIREGRRLNFLRFNNWCARQQELIAQDPKAKAAFEEALREAAKPSPASTSS